MYLKIFNKMSQCVLFNISTGKAGELQAAGDIKASGFFQQIDGLDIAIYPGDEGLMLTINADTWALSDSHVLTSYYHHYDEAVTTFSVNGAQNNFELTYPGWWADRDDFDINPMAVSCEEENSEEDFFAYIHLLKDNHEMAANLQKFWSNNIAAV